MKRALLASNFALAWAILAALGVVLCVIGVAAGLGTLAGRHESLPPAGWVGFALIFGSGVCWALACWLAWRLSRRYRVGDVGRLAWPMAATCAAILLEGINTGVVPAIHGILVFLIMIITLFVGNAARFAVQSELVCNQGETP